MKNIKDKGKIYDVLSVGFFGKMEQASIKINENGKGKVYLLPNELLGWALEAVAMSNMNMNAFPSEVEFGILDGKCYAEVL